MQSVRQTSPDAVLAQLRAAGLGRGEPLAVSLSRDGLGLASAAGCWALDVAGVPDAVATLRQIEQALRPRWVWWSAHSTAATLVRHGLRPALCWDIAEVHRLLAGGGPDDPAHVWALLFDLDVTQMPRTGQLDLLTGSDTEATAADDPESPTSARGYLRAEWVAGGWSRSATRLAQWAALALAARDRQSELLGRTRCSGDAVNTAAGESAASLLCVELEADGLPIDREAAEQILGAIIGPRPRDDADEALQRRRRDEAVLAHLPDTAAPVDLRHPGQVRSALAQIGIDVPDTRSGRLEPWRGVHPLVGALLDWRRSDRMATTYGYRWLDDHVQPDGRLRGSWAASDGAAGRMTAQAGLHNLPAELRPAVLAPAGHMFVRADLGQVEPRVLAAISGDHALAQASREEDLYAPVARRLRVERAVAKVAVLAAMYGQTSGTAGEALAGLNSAYPVAMRYLATAYGQGRAGQDVRTHGGRLVRMPPLGATESEAARHGALSARGRYARNAVVQGSAAELFKQWAVTVRSSGRATGARIVLCLHDELLVLVAEERASDVAGLLARSLPEVAQRWARSEVRFVADISVVRRWSDAKG